jgi:predicted nucleic acid-binding protein
MEIVLDEWIVHYILSKRNRKKAFDFLEKVFNKCDRFVTIEGEGLVKKIYKMAKKSGNLDVECRLLVKWFMAKFPTHSKKFQVLETSSEIILPNKLKGINLKNDLYLVKAAIATGGTIVTTDRKLKEKLTDVREINIQIFEDFFRQYI